MSHHRISTSSATDLLIRYIRLNNTSFDQTYKYINSLLIGIFDDQIIGIIEIYAPCDSLPDICDLILRTENNRIKIRLSSLRGYITGAIFHLLSFVTLMFHSPRPASLPRSALGIGRSPPSFWLSCSSLSTIHTNQKQNKSRSRCSFL